jgi:hypothetical protein
MKQVSSFTLILFLLFSCSSVHKTADQERPFQINFGHTGGFTNVTLEFLIKENREAFSVENSNLISIKKISLKEMREINKIIKSADFKNLKSEPPGNINYFIKVQNREFENKVVWTPPSRNPSLNELYLKLSEIVK